ncbi:MAG: histidine kinase [Verrucomicrobiae bacterium]|nr:histidine kinase [Verrucomicrobiae bacterium]
MSARSRTHQPGLAARVRRCAGLLLCAGVAGAEGQLMREQSAGPLATAGAHEFLIQNWDTRSGLPGVSVTALERTPDGFLWVGTRQGLARFDGAQFRVVSPHHLPTFKSDFITSLRADTTGHLWIGTTSGLYRLRRGSTQASGLTVVQPNVSVAALALDRAGVMWAAIPNAGIVGFATQERGTPEPARAPLANPVIPPVKSDARLFVDAADRLALFTGGELWVRDAGRWRRIEGADAGAGRWQAVWPDAHGGWWVMADRQLLRVTDAGVAPVASSIRQDTPAPRTPVDVLLEGRNGRIWAGAHGGGIFCFHPETGWQRLTHRRPRPTGAVTCLYEDDGGVLWAGTSNRGLYQVRPRHVTAWSLPVAAHEGVPHTVCVARDGTVWVGTDGAGVFRFGNGVITRYGREHGLEQPSVTAILEDRHTNLWCATARGLYRFEDGRFRRITDRATGRKTITALFEDRDGRLWVGMAGAVALRRDESFEVFETPQRIRPLEVRAIAQDSTGRIWLGVRGAGVFRLENGRLQRLESFPRPLVLSLHCDAEDALWVGTVNGGLTRVKGRATRHWTTRDGLPDNTVYAIQEDARGTLWFSCNEGVFGVDKRALLAHERGTDPPLLAYSLPIGGDASDLGCLASGQPASARSPDGRFWFPTLRGVLAFDPLALPRQRQPPEPVVEEVRVDGVPLEERDRVDELWRVPSTARRIEFHYTAPEMEIPERLRFRYRLEGLDTEWVEAGAQRTASYARLPPGLYRFQVMVGAHGVWQPAKVPLTLEIVPRFWERRAFQLGGVALLLVVVAASVRFAERARLRRRLARLETEKAMEQERARIARDLHDEIGSGLTEILLMGELAGRSDAPAAQLRAQVHALTEKVRQLAAAMDAVVWTINPRNDSLPRLASYLCDHAREFFRPTPIACRIDVPDELPELPVSAAQRHHLFLAVKEALNNVARHSGASEVWLRLRCHNGRLQLSVEDNGRGLGPAAPTTGDGLANMRARLQAVGGRAEIEPGQHGGTVVRFILPMNAPGAPDDPNAA